MLVDNDHAGDKVSCRSRSCFLTYVITAAVQWFSKKQSTVKTPVFGAEFGTMEWRIDALRGLRYKLQIKEISISGHSHIYGDNKLIVHDTCRPE